MEVARTEVLQRDMVPAAPDCTTSMEDGNQILFNGKKLIGTDARGCVNDLCAPIPLRLDIHCG